MKMKAKVKGNGYSRTVSKHDDHTNLKAFADDAAFEKLCDEAKKYNFKMVAINPIQTVRCKKKLEGSPVHVGSDWFSFRSDNFGKCKIFKQKMRLEKGQMKSIM